MATKAIMANDNDRPDKRRGSNPLSRFFDSVVGQWKEFTQFLSDVRAEMRKVVTPSWKEVKSTTTVVIIAVAIFGVYFFLIDGLFSIAMNRLLQKLGGLQ